MKADWQSERHELLAQRLTASANGNRSPGGLANLQWPLAAFIQLRG